MPNPLQLLQDFIKTQAAESLRTRQIFEREPDLKLRQMFNADPSLEDDPNFVDITPPSDPDAPKMRVMKPPMSRTPTEVRGGRDFARSVERLLTDVPELRGRAPVIQHGPTDAASEYLKMGGFRPDEYMRTNLLGIFDHRNKNISVNPRLIPSHDKLGNHPGFTSTVGHELGHSMDVKHGPVMDQLSKLLSNYAKGRK